MEALSCTHLRCIDRKRWIAADVLGIDEGQFFEDVSRHDCLRDRRSRVSARKFLYIIKLPASPANNSKMRAKMWHDLIIF